MKATEILVELEEIRIRVYRLRRSNKNSRWFCDLMLAIESLVRASSTAVRHIINATK